MSPAFIPAPRFWLVLLPVTFLFLLVLGRLASLHLFADDSKVAEVHNVRYRFEQIEGKRGAIIDARGNLLAGTRTLMEVGVDPQATRPQDLSRLPELATLLELPLSEIEPLFLPGLNSAGSPVRWRRLSEGVSESVYDEIRALRLGGVYGTRRFQREYPHEGMAAHIVGFINRESTAVMGIERAMDFWLRGQNGWRETERDGRRRELAHLRSREVKPSDGHTVQLTLDVNVQEALEAVVNQLVETYQPHGISIIVSDPRNGAILGLANYPSFNPNQFWTYPTEVLRNRAISDVFEPGSTFKIVPAAGALNDGLIHRGEGFDCSLDHAFYNGRRIPMPRDVSPRGFMTLEEIIALSSNRGAALLGMLLGEDRLYGYARLFGFGERSGLGLTGEVVGILHRPNRWDGHMISRVPIGYAVAATPIQIHQSMAVIASGGVAYQLRLVDRVLDRDGNTVFETGPRVRHRVISESAAQEVALGLIQAVEGQGTARQARVSGYQVAGKTGTARVVIDGQYDATRHIASFTGFFPATRPEAVITVVVNQPQVSGVAFGGRIAAPVFREVAENLVRTRGIQPVWESSRMVAQGGVR